jgi:hypothetical protein
MSKNNTDVDIVLAGEVDNTGNYGATTIASAISASLPSYIPYSWRDSRDLALDDLGLVNGMAPPNDLFRGAFPAVLGDRLLGQEGGTAYYNTTTNAWDATSTLTVINPGKAYWIANRHTGHDWDYTYVGVPSAALTATTGQGVISSFKSPTAKKAGSNARAITSVKKNVNSKDNSARKNSVTKSESKVKTKANRTTSSK